MSSCDWKRGTEESVLQLLKSPRLEEEMIGHLHRSALETPE